MPQRCVDSQGVVEQFLLSIVIERASGKSFAEYAKENKPQRTRNKRK